MAPMCNHPNRISVPPPDLIRLVSRAAGSKSGGGQPRSGFRSGKPVLWLGGLHALHGKTLMPRAMAEVCWPHGGCTEHRILFCQEAGLGFTAKPDGPVAFAMCHAAHSAGIQPVGCAANQHLRMGCAHLVIRFCFCPGATNSGLNNAIRVSGNLFDGSTSLRS